MDKLVTKAEACQYLGISVDTIDRIIKRGELSAYRVSGRIRISEEAIQDYLQANPVGKILD